MALVAAYLDGHPGAKKEGHRMPSQEPSDTLAMLSVMRDMVETIQRLEARITALEAPLFYDGREYS